MSTEPRTKAAQRMIEWYQSWHRPQPRDMPGFRRRIAAIEREAAERASGGLDALGGLDLRCENYLDRFGYRGAFDLCARNNRPRMGAYTAEQWCLPCEIRARLTGGQDDE